MDAFYALVEQRRRPELRGRPMMSAGTPPGGWCWRRRTRCVPLGCGARCRSSRARPARPHAIVVPPTAYAGARRRWRSSRRHAAGRAALGGRGVPRRRRPAAVRPPGGDRRASCAPDPAGASARRLGGIASMKFVAKIASGLAKPDGLLPIPPDDVILVLLHPLPVAAPSGVGRADGRAAPNRSGIATVGDKIAAMWTQPGWSGYVGPVCRKQVALSCPGGGDGRAVEARRGRKPRSARRRPSRSIPRNPRFSWRATAGAWLIERHVEPE